MRISAAALLLLLGPSVAWAQNDQSMIVIPPAPPVVAAPSSAAPAPVAPSAPVASQTLPAVPPVQSQTLPAVPPVQSAATTPPPATAPAQPGAPPAPPAQAASAQPAPPDVAPTPANDWNPGHAVTLGVLNEVDGSTSQLSVPVGGQPAKTGDVLVSVQACATRPPQDLPDTAVFLTVQPADDGGAAPLYRGWMLRSAPGAAVVGNAAESFRVISCS
ncbi:MAG: DUF2155 domain-containing protein [Acidocella sp.]|nr:DUF2155 domain-containing protein [Acidocella sp.]